MAEFIQLHFLTSYAPSNLNRDDLGRPKTAKMGGVDRLRISSQSLKRAWRTSDVFVERLEGDYYKAFDEPDKRSEHLSVRSKKFGEKWILSALCENGLDAALAEAWSIDILQALGTADEEKKKPINKLSQVVALSPCEIKKLGVFVKSLGETLRGNGSGGFYDEIVDLRDRRDKAKEKKRKALNNELNKKLQEEILTSVQTSVDIALFGRMLASSPKYNIEAAAQVAHALTVNRIVVEDDYFTAVDDLNKHEEDAGSAHIGEAGFGSGVFYTYVCINLTLLTENLGDEALVKKTIRAFTEAAATVAPTGKQNSFGSRAYASYILAERGTQQPRQLSSAFLKPVDDEDMAGAAITRLENLKANMDKVYGDCADSQYCINVEKGDGTFAELLDFVEG